MHICLIVPRVHPQHMPLIILKQPRTKNTHTFTYKYTQKERWRECWNHNEKFNLRKEQPASDWGWVNPGLLDFMPPHHRGPLDALNSFRTSTAPFTAWRCLLAYPVPSRLLCEEDLNQWKPKQCRTGHRPPLMIQLWRKGNIGEEGDERESVGGWIAGIRFAESGMVE